MATRRSLLRVGLGSLAAAIISDHVEARAAPAMQKVNVVIPGQSVLVLNYLGGRDAGIFAKHGIDLDVDVRPFAGFLAGLPSKQCMTTAYAGIEAIEKINEGLDWAIIGPGLTVAQDIIVLKDSPLQSGADLRGKKFGTFSTGGGAFKVMRAVMIEAYHLDLLKDAHTQQVAGPALNKLLDSGQLDAVMNISSLTMSAESQPDKYRVLFSPDDYWRKKTGYPLMWSAPLIAWQSWVEQDKTRARNLATATVESFKWLAKPQNLTAAIKRHGELASVTTPAEVVEYQRWLDKKQMFLTAWDRKAVDAQWQFLELAKKAGILKKVPPEDRYALFVGELGA
jgi:ABC-type nitrate/sulfonate/bicarbonate transport system substrate-binding protein